VGENQAGLPLSSVAVAVTAAVAVAAPASAAEGHAAPNQAAITPAAAKTGNPSRDMDVLKIAGQ
jgi:hypothetical protein